MDSYSQQRFAAESAANDAYKKAKRKQDDEMKRMAIEQSIKYARRMNDESSTKRTGKTLDKKLFK
jgi:hypothetical protein